MKLISKYGCVAAGGKEFPWARMAVVNWAKYNKSKE